MDWRHYASTAICAVIAFSPAAAQEPAATTAEPTAEASVGGLDQIVVTAQRRSENLQETPIAITALTAETLSNRGITDLYGVAASTPSLYIQPYPTSSNTLTVYMRGQGTVDPQQITRDGAIGLYQDGVYIAHPQLAMVDLVDVERVEVLRGPQGTLYGRNTTGGAVNIIGRRPSGEFDLRGTLEYGSRDYFRSLTTLDLPAFGDLSVKGTFLYSNKDGYGKNPGARHDFGEASAIGGRIAARYRPEGGLTIDYSFDIGRTEGTPVLYTNQSNIGVYPGYDGDRRRAYRTVELPESHTDFRNHALTIAYEVSDAITLRSITGYQYQDTFVYQDWVESLRFRFNLQDDIKSKVFSQELQAVGSLGDRIEFVAGLYYFRERASRLEKQRYENFPLPDRLVRALSKSQAVFGQATWTPPVLEDKLKVTLGGRYTHDERSATRDLAPAFNISNNQTFNQFNPALIVQYDAAENLNLYAKVVTGYKAGGSAESAPDFTQTFGPEEVTSYEAGFKADLIDRRLRFNLAAFYSDYSGIQLDIIRDPSNPSSFEVVNAGKARIWGAEIDITAVPLDDLTFTVSYSYLNAKIKTVPVLPNTAFDPAVNPLSPYQVGDNVADFFVIAGAPKHSVNVAADWVFFRSDVNEAAIHLDYRHRDKVFTTGAAGPAIPGRNAYSNPSYGVLDGRLSLRRELSDGRTLKFAVFGKNITNKDYYAYGNGDGTGNPLTGYPTQMVAYAEPRTIGVGVDFDF